MDHVFNQLSDPMAIQDVFSLGVYDFPVFVHHIIILKQVFTHIEIVGFHLFLGIFNSPGDQVMFYGLALFHAQASHDR